MHGIICIWSGAIVDIPDGWVICDGTLGTPDLRSRFVIAAHAALPPGTTGGLPSHSHSGGTNMSQPKLSSGDMIQNFEPNGLWDEATDQHLHSYITGLSSTYPPYFALCYIMKL